MTKNKPKNIPAATKYLLVLVLGLAVLLAVIFLVELDFRAQQRDQLQPTQKPLPARNQEVRLSAVITVCEKITTDFDGTDTIKGTAGYRYMSGYVENYGEIPVKFVRLQLIWLDNNNDNVRESEIYAVRDTELAPGEKATFETSTRNTLIETCDVKVLDWWTSS